MAAVLLVGLFISPAFAATEDIELDPEEGDINEWIDINGEDFTPSDSDALPTPFYSEVDIYFTSQEADEGDDIDDEIDIYEKVKTSVMIDDDGDLDTRFRVPSELGDGDDDEDVTGGTYYVCVTYDGRDNIEAVAEFTVMAAEIELDDDEGTVNTKVKITGKDFDDKKDITVKYDGNEVDIHSGDTDTDSDGEFVTHILIPPSYAGEHTISVEDEQCRG
jgi:hypothetical protein